MQKAQIIAGSYPKGYFVWDEPTGFSVGPKQPGFFSAGEKLYVESVELVTEENKKKFVGAGGWGLVGVLTLGPLGALAGILTGGNQTEVCFAVRSKNGKKFLAKGDLKLYQKLLAEAFR